MRRNAKHVLMLLAIVLFIAGCRSPDADLLRAIAKRDERTVQAALERGANPNATDDTLTSALMLAVQQRQHAIAGALMDRGANPQLADRQAQSPLMAAVALGEAELVRLLIHYRADVNQQDQEGRTALDLAQQQAVPEIVNALLDAGAKTRAHLESEGLLLRAFDIGTLTAMRDALARGSDPDTRLTAYTSPQGKIFRQCTPLMIAAGTGKLDLVRLLLESGAEVDAQVTAGDNQGWTALDFALAAQQDAAVPVELIELLRHPIMRVTE